MFVAAIVCLSTLLPTQAEPVKDPAKLKSAHDQAKVVAEASALGDFETVIDTMMPEVVKAMGGRTEALKKVRDGMETMKKSGVDYVSATVSTPDSIHPADSDLFVIVPMSAVVKTKAGKFKVKSYLLGHSADRGETWKFVDGTPGEAEIRKLLPNLPKVMRFPNKEKPQKLSESAKKKAF